MKAFYVHFFALCIILISFSGCSKKDDETSTPAPTPTSTDTTLSLNSPTQANFKLDGTVYAFNTSVSGSSAFFSNSSSLAGFPDSSSTVFGAGVDKQVGSATSSLTISKGTFKFLMPVDTARLSLFFTPQSIPFASLAANGVSVNYTDGTGAFWSTDSGSMDQTGSSMVINERKVSIINGEKYIRVRFTFNCKLYNFTGSSITLTDGTAVLNFWSEY